MNNSGSRKRAGRNAEGTVQYLRLKLTVFALV